MTIWTQPLPPDGFLRPLDVILLEHTRQHEISRWLLVRADDRQLAPLREPGQALLAFLTRDLLLHHKDEEEDLFPLLKTRCEPEDDIEGILTELNRDHATERFLVRDIAVDLRAIIEGKKPEAAARFFESLYIFAEGQQRHLWWENKMVLPLASSRLTHQDIEALGRNMAARRRIDYPGLS
jgi:iron-sulfur cluster repair protein YtfE (RIC family)